jgi:hypothetical protein
MTTRWRRTARPCEPSSRSSMASSSTTCPAGTTRRRTNSPRSHRGGSPSPKRFHAGHRPAVRQPRATPLELRGTLGGSLESSRRGAHGGGPLERGVRALPARGVWRRRGRSHGHRAAPSERDWRDKYINWMARGELPSERSEARHIARMAKSFTLVDGELYKRAASGILQRCVPIS